MRPKCNSPLKEDLLGVLASKRLPCPSRAFDMAHCSRCLIPWAELGGLYLIEVDQVLRPGGYWILSGLPIRWKKYWKGWEKTEEDLNAGLKLRMWLKAYAGKNW
ncbi:hypothetical protein GH714_040198 [Hevea brasiliensis]|uniref:Methyltransferase n=1 Tax=Hevea brasiliensis TaxID=3981 RepID=A0A6A6MU10_HEVBR|nr:hypothetical protein GH714_040198 [Hevea brasiliensis]